MEIGAHRGGDVSQGRGADPNQSSAAPTESLAVSPELTHIAREVADDHSVRVVVGAPGGGSYADLESRTLTLDSEHIATVGRFVSAHEGAHLSDTATFDQLSAAPEELAKKFGLLALKNVVEDCAINDRFVRDFAALSQDTLNAYPRAEGEVGFLGHPEVEMHARALGFLPKYARGLAALLQDWSELRHDRGFNRPDSEYKRASYAGGALADKDLETFVKRVLPDFRDAVAMKYPKGASGEEMLAAAVKRHMWCEKVLYPELERLVQADLERLTKDGPKQSSADKGAPEQGAGNEGEEQSGSAQASSQGNSQSNNQSNGGQSGQEQESGGDEDAAQREFQKLPEVERRRVAKELLAGFDDAVREALKSLFDKQDEAPKAADVIKQENEQERHVETEARAQQEFMIGGKGLRDAMLRNLSPYQRYYLDVVPKIDQIEGQLKDAFIPDMHFRWQRSQPSGPKVTMTQAMRFEATGEGYRELFERRIDPTRPDIGIVVLVDRSGSMDGEKIENAIRAAIFTKEVMQRIGVQCAIVGFADTQDVLCDFRDDTQEHEIQERIMAGLTLGGGTQDAAALKYAANLLTNLGARRGSVVVISDAGSSEGELLKPLVRAVEEVGIPVIHFGIGSGTSDHGGYYTRSFGDLDPQSPDENNFFEIFTSEMEKLAQELL